MHLCMYNVNVYDYSLGDYNIAHHKHQVPMNESVHIILNAH